ncbi:GGDEF domain-containing protein [Thalassotalea sp. ND16A]|uniref:GGDEF domain-containing protein n=1 Tax=Thalassotalea sp. ND16A TaxID=1535422 RepID=UPI00051A4675|nr:GGDEF domain-containing protein [Thalassotalea sp. ND16A]KGJ89409.1 putative diguanylate cyclase [Thalassotalea sp. ND16A]
MSTQLIHNRTDSRFIFAVGFLWFAFLSCSIISPAINAQENNQQDFDKLINESIKIRSSDIPTYNKNLTLLEQNLALLTASQQEELIYLQAYKLGLEGKYSQSIAIHQKVENSKNVKVRVRSLRTQLNLAYLINQYPLSNQLIDRLLAEVVNLDDLELKNSIHEIIGYFYNHIGAFQLALNYLDLVKDGNSTPRNYCWLQQVILLANLGLEKIHGNDPQILAYIDFCLSHKENISAQSVILENARFLNQEHNFVQANQHMQAYQSLILASTYTPHHKTLFGQLTLANWGLNDINKAQYYGLKAIALMDEGEHSKWDQQTYQTMAKVSQSQGDEQQAIQYLLKYQAMQQPVASLAQQKALARAQIEHTLFSKKAHKNQLEDELKSISQKNNQASVVGDEYAQNFANNRLIFAMQFGIILLLGGSLLYLRHLQISTKDKGDHDPLTNLLNRNGFIDSAVSTVSLQRSNKAELAILVVNVDNFRAFNQTFGIVQGDTLLIELSQLLASFVDGDQHIGRTGADEFILVFPNKNSKTLTPIAEAIKAKIAVLFAQLKNQLDSQISMSMAISDSNLSDYSLKYFLTDTSKALMKAKALGGDQIYYFNKSMTDREKFKGDGTGLRYIFE